MNDIALMRESRSFISNFHWNAPKAVTLTFKKGLFRDGALVVPGSIEHSQNVRHFLNVLNKSLFGGLARKGCLLTVAAVLERPPWGHAHYHLVLDKPNHIPDAYFEWLVGDIWRNTTWGHRIVHLGSDGGPRWINYITKLRTKHAYDEAIDWENTHNARARAVLNPLPFKLRMKRSTGYLAARCEQAKG